MHTHIHACTHTCTHMHAYMHTHTTHTHTHTHIQPHTHTHTHTTWHNISQFTQLWSQSWPWSLNGNETKDTSSPENMQNVQTFPSAGFIWLFYIKHNLFPFLLASDIFATFATYTILVYDITDTDCWAQNYNALMVMFVTSLMYRVLGTKLQCTSGHVYDITIQMLGTKLQCTRGHVCATFKCRFSRNRMRNCVKKRDFLLVHFLPFLLIRPMVLLWSGSHSNRGRK